MNRRIKMLSESEVIRTRAKYAKKRQHHADFADFLYVIGIYAIRITKNFARLIRRKTAAVRAGMGAFLRWAGRPLRRFADESVRLGEGFRKAGKELRRAAKRGLAPLLSLMVRLPLMALMRHRRFLTRALNWLTPPVALAVLLVTLNYWGAVGYALQVSANGVTVGYVSDENMLDQAVAMANERIMGVPESAAIERNLQMTVAMVTDSAVLNVNEACDALLKSAGNPVERACGLYIDGKFEAALSSTGTMVQLLNKIKAAYVTDSEDETITFSQTVEMVDGLYPSTAVITAEQMEKKLTATHEETVTYVAYGTETLQSIADKFKMTLGALKEMNPDVRRATKGTEVKVIRQTAYLQVAVVRTETYTESIPYNTIRREDDTHYLGYEKVVVAGRAGKQSVVAEVKLADGIEIDRTIVSTKTVSEPVDRVLIIGSKVYTPGTVKGDGVSTGTFIWPLPATKTISSGYGYRDGEFHAGIDISNGNTYGLPIIASDGGTIVAVNTSGSGSSYGKFVMIDHGNGYQTMYAHCSSVEVTVGQKVAQGELIARVGNTGRSFGAHLHFEIRVNEEIVNPLPFLGIK